VVVKEMYRRKDFYVLFILTALITLLMGTVNFFNDDRIVRYLKEICLLLIWISSLVISLSTAARQIPAERESKTLFPLLAKPVTRGQVVAGKFMGCWMACGIALGLFYLFFGFISGSRERVWPAATYIQALWLHWHLLGIVIAFTLLGSVVFTAPSSTITINMIVIVGILLVGRHLHKLALRMAEPSQTLVTALYYCIPHLEFFDVRDLIIHNSKSISWSVCGVATLYAWAWAGIFLLGAWLVFRKQRLN
jgi:ABC-type transport system involved in multi-copper enzyme maturation permease subunit